MCGHAADIQSLFCFRESTTGHNIFNNAFINNLDHLPDIDAILRGESRACPDDIDLQYAVASALVTRAVRADGDTALIGNILDYAGCFPQREMGIMLVADLHRAIGAEMFAVPQFAGWAEQVGELLSG